VIEDFPHVPLFSLHASQVTKIKKEIAQVTKEMKSVMEKEMTKRMETCKKNEIDSHLKVIVGLPSEEILKIVKNQKIDLIVMAKRRKLKGIKSILTLGSVSRKIIEGTSCPVLMMDAEKK
jgi:nucleotide-binding universal stress UspA family protein